MNALAQHGIRRAIFVRSRLFKGKKKPSSPRATKQGLTSNPGSSSARDSQTTPGGAVKLRFLPKNVPPPLGQMGTTPSLPQNEEAKEEELADEGEQIPFPNRDQNWPRAAVAVVSDGQEQNAGASLLGRLRMNGPSFSNLVAANEVEDYADLALPTAEPYDAPVNRNASRRFFIKIASIFLCLLLMIVGVTLGLTIPKSKTNYVEGSLVPTSLYDTFSPTSAPTTAAPTYSFTPLLPSFTLEAIANDPKSPQALAYQWLSEDLSRETYSKGKQVQRMALATFYYATIGDSWKLNTNWMEHAIDECLWYTKAELLATSTASSQNKSLCDEEGNYLELVLTMNGLRGTLPNELILLSKLEVLDVADNEIGGSIFTEIGSMGTLKEFLIDFNDIEGTLPTELGLLTNLELLVGHTNPNMEGSIPTFIGNMVSLRLLHIHDNPLMTGTLPSELGNLSNMNWFKVYFPSLSGTIPTEFGNWAALDSFDMRYAEMTGTIPSEVGLWTNVRSFVMFGSSLVGGTIPSELGKLTMLEFLMLSGLQLTSTIPSEWWALPFLMDVNLADNVGLSGTIPTEVGLATSLIWIEGEQSTCKDVIGVMMPPPMLL